MNPLSKKHDLISYKEAKLLSRKYVKWLYELTNEGKIFDLPFVNRSKDFPKKDDIEHFTYGHEYELNDYNYIDVSNNAPCGLEIPYFERIYDCGSYIEGYYNKVSGKYIVNNGNYCEKRICPICCLRKSHKEAQKIAFMMDNFKEEYEYFFLTLTLPDNADGFREELDLYNSCLRDLFRFFGYDTQYDTVCKGVYGSYEVKLGENSKKWHPHLHMVLAYPKDSILNYEAISWTDRYKKHTEVKDLAIKWHTGEVKHFSTDYIRQRYIELIKARSNKYNDYLSKKNFLNIGFERCYNVEKGRNELTKYFVDFNTLETKEDFYVYIRDTFGKKQRVKRGIFIWNDDWESKFELWKAHKEEEELKQFLDGQIFILYNSVCPMIATWTGANYLVEYRYVDLEPLPYSSNKVKRLKKQVAFME